MIDGNAEKLCLKLTSRHLRRLKAEYFLAGASEKGRQELLELYTECMKDGDAIGAASCQMTLGDNCHSLPFTSPIVLNLALVNPTLNSAAYSRHPLKSDTEADRLYQSAFDLFSTADCDRGKASIHLRRACVSSAEYLNSMTLTVDSSISKSKMNNFEQLAGSHFQQALDLCGEDGTMAQIVLAHRIVLRIMTHYRQASCKDSFEDGGDPIGEAAKIGSWAKENDNMSPARLAGLLLLSVARKLSEQPQNLAAASQCCVCAAACFHGAQDRISELTPLCSTRGLVICRIIMHKYASYNPKIPVKMAFVTYQSSSPSRSLIPITARSSFIPCGKDAGFKNQSIRVTRLAANNAGFFLFSAALKRRSSSLTCGVAELPAIVRASISIRSHR